MHFIDVFCGAGGFTEGFKQSGWSHVVGIEIDKFAADTYQSNHGDVILGDARQVSGADVRAYMKKHGVRKLDAILGSPPCTSFSTAGLRKPGDDRDDLYKEVIRLGRELKPRWIVIENVIGILSKRDERSGKLFVDLILDELKGIGYKAEWRVLSALDFGVPQMRKRVIFIARRDVNKHLPIRFPVAAGVRKESLPVSKVLLDEKQVPAKFFLSRDRVQRFKDKGYAKFLDVGRACPTVRASYFKSHGEHALVPTRSGGARLLTPKEFARIQGFKDSYVWEGSMTQVYKQIGNAVAPPMAAGIAKILM